MRWLLTKALRPYVLIAATARAARAAAEGEGREIQARADALQLRASVSDISAGLAAYELTRNPDLLGAGYVARPHPATWW
jgi:CHASE3 domain sensor protein